MKNLFSLAFMLFSISASQVFAVDTHTFFDFNNFETEIQSVYTNEKNIISIENGLPYAEIGSEMFMLDNWLVSFTNGAAEDPFSMRDSYSKRVSSEEQGTVLGIRARFPEWPFASEAYIKPTFQLLPFKYNGEYANINNGVVTNVGSVKSFSMWVNGRYFPFSMGVRVRDNKNKLVEFPLGSVNYVGWRKLAYINSTFSDRIINNIYPPTRIYPGEIPFLVFDSFVVYRQGNHEGGDFVTYLGSSQIEYIPFITEQNMDINDEAEWGLIQAEQKRFAETINRPLYDQLTQYEYARQRITVPNGQEAATQNNQETAQENQ